MGRILRSILKDRPLWIDLLLFVVLAIRVFDQPAPDPRPVNEQARDLLARWLAGEQVELPMGSGESIRLDPILDEDGKPIEILGEDGKPLDILEFMDAAARSMPGRLAELEEKHGPGDDRAIAVRSGLVATLRLEGKTEEAAELAERNLSIALGSKTASAASKLKAVKSVVDSLPMTPSRARLIRLREIADRYGGQAPVEAIEVYVNIGLKQLDSGRRDETERTLRTALNLAAATGTEDSALIPAHLGVSSLAWKRGDCKTAVSEAEAALDLIDRDELTRGFLRQVTMRKIQPMMRDCRSNRWLKKLAQRFSDWLKGPRAEP